LAIDREVEALASPPTESRYRDSCIGTRRSP
jgi:hypothetical protein